MGQRTFAKIFHFKSIVLYVNMLQISMVKMFGLPMITVLSVAAGTGIIILALIFWGLTFKEVKS